MNEVKIFIGICNLCSGDCTLDGILSGKTSSEIEAAIKSQATHAVSSIIVPYITAISACVFGYIIFTHCHLF